MKVLLWIAGGLTAAAMGGAGMAQPSENGIYDAGVIQTSQVVAGIQDPEVIRNQRQLLQIEQEELRRAVEMAQEVIHEPDLERILHEMEWAMDQVDYEEMQFAVEEEMLQLEHQISGFQDYDFMSDYESSLQDYEFDLSELDVYLEDMEFDFSDISFDLSDLDIRVPAMRYLGRSSRLELLEMTYQQQDDPGLASFNEAKTLLFDQKYQDARERFLQVVMSYANSAYVDDAAFWAIYALEQMRGQNEAAFKAYQEFVGKYQESPFTEHARASMVQLAGLLYRQGMEEYKSYIEEAREDPEDEIRLYALQALVRMEESDAVASIEAVLSDGSASSRLKRAAVDLLRRQDAPGAIPLMEKTAREHADPKVRRNAISALGSRRSRESFDTLIRLYQNEQSVNARRYICDAVGSMRSTDFASDAAAFLAGAVQDDADEDVREQALSELVGFEADISISYLKSLLDSTTEPVTRRLVLSAISRSEDPGRVEILIREIQTGADERLRLYSVEYLGRVAGPEALDALISVANSDMPENIRVKAVDETGDFEGSKATGALISIAGGNTAEAVRAEAIDELGNRQVPESFSALSAIAAGQSGNDLREKALSELRQWGGEAAQILEEIALNDRESNMRRSAVSALGRLEEGAGWDGLLKVYQSEDEARIRSQALDYLWRINEERSLDTVISAAKSDRDSEIRRYAVRMLGRSESEKARQALRDILNIPPAKAA